MKFSIYLFLAFQAFFLSAQTPQAYWITPMVNQNQTNTWIGFRNEVSINEIPRSAMAKIAVDSKYWLWINGEMVVREGGIKRGPTPTDTYYDYIDIAPFLKEGKNVISVLTWYFGKDGFSHKSSGKGALLFDCQAPGISIVSSRQWSARLLPAYQTAPPPYPNFRLPESSILYDARLDIGNWQNDTNVGLGECIELGGTGYYPWNKLFPRPIPFWKDYGLSAYENETRLTGAAQDTIVCRLPHNAQVTPYMKFTGKSGQRIVVCTDNYLQFEKREVNIRAEYIAKSGAQEFEFPGWMNGHRVYYIVPKDFTDYELKYRESGYDCAFAGGFTCSDPFYNLFCEKAVRTLYVNMRDTYMDCPERERAQWTGDAANEATQASYALSPSVQALTKKWLYEIVGWQKPNGQLYAPVPAGNWDKELSGQVLSSIGYFGLWNYYLQSGDKNALVDLYDGIQKYLALWKKSDDGTVEFRHGEWTWGDWGSNIDIEALHSALYFHALKGMALVAREIGKTADSDRYEKRMAEFKTAFNARYWNGTAYRSPGYNGATDDRIQALAAVAGLAERQMYPAILKVLKTEFHASPYMERYVMQALFEMGYADYAVERYKKRFETMVNDQEYTTLWEVWDKSGSINHAWSGGGLIMMYQYVCGISPVEAGYRTFEIIPRPVFQSAAATVESVAGTIRTSYEKSSRNFTLNAHVPKGTSCILGLPNEYRELTLNGKTVWKNGKQIPQKTVSDITTENGLLKMKVSEGNWKVVAKR